MKTKNPNVKMGDFSEKTGLTTMEVVIKDLDKGTILNKELTKRSCIEYLNKKMDFIVKIKIVYRDETVIYKKIYNNLGLFIKELDWPESVVRIEIEKK